jgi:hypothetical protein
MAAPREPDCRTCAHGTDDGGPFEKVVAVDCHATWADCAIALNVVEHADQGLRLPMPFACIMYRRASAEACGCDRADRHTCEGHR